MMSKPLKHRNSKPQLPKTAVCVSCARHRKDARDTISKATMHKRWRAPAAEHARSFLVALLLVNSEAIAANIFAAMSADIVRISGNSGQPDAMDTISPLFGGRNVLGKLASSQTSVPQNFQSLAFYFGNGCTKFGFTDPLISSFQNLSALVTSSGGNCSFSERIAKIQNKLSSDAIGSTVPRLTSVLFFGGDNDSDISQTYPSFPVLFFDGSFGASLEDTSAALLAAAGDSTSHRIRIKLSQTTAAPPKPYTTDNPSSSGIQMQNTVVAVLIVMVVIFALGFVASLYFYLRRRSRQRNEALGLNAPGTRRVRRLRIQWGSDAERETGAAVRSDNPTSTLVRRRRWFPFLFTWEDEVINDGSTQLVEFAPASEGWSTNVLEPAVVELLPVKMFNKDEAATARRTERIRHMLDRRKGAQTLPRKLNTQSDPPPGRGIHRAASIDFPIAARNRLAVESRRHSETTIAVPPTAVHSTHHSPAESVASPQTPTPPSSLSPIEPAQSVPSLSRRPQSMPSLAELATMSRNSNARTSPPPDDDVISVRTVNESHISAFTCAICIQEYADGDRLRELPCRHSFHVSCIDPWLTSHSAACPLCKRSAGPSVRANTTPDGVVRGVVGVMPGVDGGVLVHINSFRYTAMDDDMQTEDGGSVHFGDDMF
ncbi:hypothetical protein BJ742DRAFT_190444 [Cladochytrium replicatum]|nr:hypothetical protein BJ742DRAFT_190444 [Cladochytrium replicatum]